MNKGERDRGREKEREREGEGEDDTVAGEVEKRSEWLAGAAKEAVVVTPLFATSA